MYNMSATYVLAGDTDEAFEWLGRLQGTGEFNLTGIGIDADFASVKDDPRLQRLFPTASELADPFVEPVGIIHEWRGESAADQFGWIARDIGDVNGDGVHDVTTSAPSRVRIRIASRSPSERRSDSG